MLEKTKRARSLSTDLSATSPLKKAKADESSEKFGTNDYSGWTPKKGDKIDRVQLSELSPQSFFEEYVAKRKPVVITGSINDAKWKAKDWDIAHLSAKAGDCLLKVEYREDSKDRFGQAKEVKMRFSEFLSGLSKGDDLHYLTTQDLVRDEEGRPEIIAPPLTHLLDEFPLRPELTGKLVPANINIWIGNSKDGSVRNLRKEF